MEGLWQCLNCLTKQLSLSLLIDGEMTVHRWVKSVYVFARQYLSVTSICKIWFLSFFICF